MRTQHRPLAPRPLVVVSRETRGYASAALCPTLRGRRRRARASQQTTGIVGLEVVPNGREVLMQLSQKLLEDVKAVPESAYYRQAVEALYKQRLEVCKSHAEVEAIEATLGQGQIEELIAMARDEERLIPKMLGASPPPAYPSICFPQPPLSGRPSGVQRRPPCVDVLAAALSSSTSVSVGC